VKSLHGVARKEGAALEISFSFLTVPAVFVKLIPKLRNPNTLLQGTFRIRARGSRSYSQSWILPFQSFAKKRDVNGMQLKQLFFVSSYFSACEFVITAILFKGRLHLD
jgi:hypothetical protein